MADEAQEKQEQDRGEAQPSSKSKLSFKTLILIGMPLVMVQAVLAYFLVARYIKPHLPETKPKVEEKVSEPGKPVGDVDLSQYVTFPVNDVIVNPAESQGQRYLSVSVVLYVPALYAESIATIEPEIRAVIIEQISRKRMDELDDYRDQQMLRDEIRDHVNATVKANFASKFKDMEIPRVVFSKYTLQ